MDNKFQEKYYEFLSHTNNHMFTFEVTKCCNYSSFVSIYKTQTLNRLYENICHHFGNIVIKSLFFISPDNEKIYIQPSYQSVSDFVSSYLICNPIKLVPIYKLPNPVVYRLFIEDCNCCK
jgi:hypothetical protein